MLPLPAGTEAASGVGALPYVRPRPERTLLYQLVQEYYPELKAHLAAQGTVLPGYVEREFEDYLKCGCLEHGFLRVRCGRCHAEHLVDFVLDAPYHGRRIKILAIVDDCTKESVDLVADFGISGQYVTRILDQAVRFRGCPKAIRTDQGPEFTGKALDQWAYEHGVQLKLIQPRKPTQNAYIESFNGKFRDECLNEHWFQSLAHARAVIQAWRQDYNERRPHSMLDYQTPAEVAEQLRQR